MHVFNHILDCMVKNACFKFFVCMICYYKSCKLATSFSTCSIFVISGKRGKSL